MENLNAFDGFTESIGKEGFRINHKREILIGIVLVVVSALVYYTYFKDPPPDSSSSARHRGAGPHLPDIKNNKCTPKMKETCYPCDPISELAGDPSSPQEHQNPQCGVNRITGDYGMCKPATSWSNPNEMLDPRWPQDADPPDTMTIEDNECYNCSGSLTPHPTGDPSIHKLFDNDYDINFFCESSCGNDMTNPDNFELDTRSPTDMYPNPWYGFPKKYNENLYLSGVESSPSSLHLDKDFIEGPFLFNSNIDSIFSIGNDFVKAHAADLAHDGNRVYWLNSSPSFTDPSPGYMYIKSSPNSQKITSAQMCSRPGNRLKLEQGEPNFFDDECNTLDENYFPESGYLTIDGSVGGGIVGITNNINDYNINPSKNTDIIQYKDPSYVVGPSPNHPSFENDDHPEVHNEMGYNYQTFQNIVDNAFDFQCKNNMFKPKNEELFREVDNNRYYNLGDLDVGNDTNIRIGIDNLNINLHIDEISNPSSSSPHQLEFNNIGLNIADNHDLSKIIETGDDGIQRIKPEFVLEPPGEMGSYQCMDESYRFVWKDKKCSDQDKNTDDDFNINDCKPYATDEGVVLPFKCTNQCSYDPNNKGSEYILKPDKTNEMFSQYLSENPNNFIDTDLGSVRQIAQNLDVDYFECLSPYKLDPGSAGGITASCVDHYIQLSGCHRENCGQVYSALGQGQNILNTGERSITSADLPLPPGCTVDPESPTDIICDDDNDCIFRPPTVNCSNDIIRSNLSNLNRIASSDLDVLIGQNGQNNGLFSVNVGAPIQVGKESEISELLDTCLTVNDDNTISNIPNLCKDDHYKIIVEQGSTKPSYFLTGISNGSSQQLSQFLSYGDAATTTLSDYCELKKCRDYIPSPSLPDRSINHDLDLGQINQYCNPPVNITYNYKTDFDDMDPNEIDSNDIFQLTDTRGDGIDTTTLNNYMTDPKSFPGLTTDNCLNPEVNSIPPTPPSSNGEYYISGCSNECTIDQTASFSELNPHSKININVLQTKKFMTQQDITDSDLDCGFDGLIGDSLVNYKNPNRYHSFDASNYDLSMFDQFDLGATITGDYQNDNLTIACESGIIKFRGCNHVTEEYDDSRASPHYSAKIYAENAENSEKYSNLFPHEANEEAGVDVAKYNNWASCINFIPEINLNNLPSKDLHYLNITDIPPEAVSYPYQSPDNIDNLGSSSEDVYPSIGALCTNEENAIFSFGDYTTTGNNITITSKVCRDGFVPYGKLFNGQHYMSNYDSSPCNDLDNSNCNYRIDCKLSDGICTSIDNSGCVNITTPGLNIPGSIGGLNYIKKIDIGSLAVDSGSCMNKDDDIFAHIPVDYSEIYKNEKMLSLMHCNHNDIVEHTDRLTGVINVMDPTNEQQVNLPGLQYGSNGYEKGDIRFRLNLFDHGSIIEDGLMIENTDYCPFGEILQLNEPGFNEKDSNDFITNNHNNFHYSCKECPPLDPNSEEGTKTVCGFDQDFLIADALERRYNAILELVKVVENGQGNEGSTYYDQFKNNYRLIPDENNNICKDGFFYQYEVDEIEGHDKKGSCVTKKCKVSGDPSENYESTTGFYIPNSGNVWWAKDRIKGLTGIVSSSPNIIENDDGGDGVFGINAVIPKWDYGGEEVLTIYPEYNRLSFDAVPEETNDDNYIVEGFENIGYNYDDYFSSPGRQRYCSGNPDALRDSCNASRDVNPVEKKIFTREPDDTADIYNASTQDTTYLIENPCIHHIDPTSYYPDEESCLYENIDKLISENLMKSGTNSNLWIPFDADRSDIGYIHNNTRDPINDLSMFNNIYSESNYSGIDPSDIDEPSTDIRGICIRNKKLLYDDFFSDLRENGIYPNQLQNLDINNTNEDILNLLPKKVQSFFEYYSKGDKYYGINSPNWGPISPSSLPSSALLSSNKINPQNSDIKNVFLTRVTSRYINSLLGPYNPPIQPERQATIEKIKQYFIIPPADDSHLPITSTEYNQYIRMIWVKSFLLEFQKFYGQVLNIQDELYAAQIVDPGAEIAPDGLNEYMYPIQDPTIPEGTSTSSIDCDNNVDTTNCIPLVKNTDDKFNSEQQNSSNNFARGFEYWERKGKYWGKNDEKTTAEVASIPNVSKSINNIFAPPSPYDDSSGCPDDDVCLRIYGNFDDNNVSNWLENMDSCGWTMKMSKSDNNNKDNLLKHKNKYARQCNRLKWQYGSSFSGIEGTPEDNIFPRSDILNSEGDPYPKYLLSNDVELPNNNLPNNSDAFIGGEFNDKDVPPNFYKKEYTNPDSEMGGRDSTFTLNASVPESDNINFCISDWDDKNKVLTCNYLPMTSPDNFGGDDFPEKYIQNIKQPFMGFLKEENGNSLYNIDGNKELQPFFNTFWRGEFSAAAHKRTISDSFQYRKTSSSQNQDELIGNIIPVNNSTLTPSRATISGEVIPDFHIPGGGMMTYDNLLQDLDSVRARETHSNLNKEWKIPCSDMTKDYFIQSTLFAQTGESNSSVKVTFGDDTDKTVCTTNEKICWCTAYPENQEEGRTTMTPTIGLCDDGVPITIPKQDIMGNTSNIFHITERKGPTAQWGDGADPEQDAGTLYWLEGGDAFAAAAASGNADTRNHAYLYSDHGTKIFPQIFNNPIHLNPHCEEQLCRGDTSFWGPNHGLTRTAAAGRRCVNKYDQNVLCNTSDQCSSDLSCIHGTPQACVNLNSGPSCEAELNPLSHNYGVGGKVTYNKDINRAWVGFDETSNFPGICSAYGTPQSNSIAMSLLARSDPEGEHPNRPMNYYKDDTSALKAVAHKDVHGPANLSNFFTNTDNWSVGHNPKLYEEIDANIWKLRVGVDYPAQSLVLNTYESFFYLEPGMTVL